MPDETSESSLLLLLAGVSSGSGPVTPTNGILTEASDFIVTEGGDYLVQES